ncbi:uncharacterized protein LOC131151055 [Malania oleifera]|uniref:uncharacterized protein LOC131151055 n=1 Tax=Malania oleifera TaxID=397392 RepID=UPI0025ADC3A2|nr:uncharacterized protein LOC131151055 [Malania oleifera]XP_057958214.1 uncharacterized protein LOC131151055 [Malania oleifera]
MGVEKHGSKGGGSYVGGFFQLFDWNAKSRKKLFSSKSDSPERSKQGKRGDTNSPMTRLHLVDEDESGAGSSIKGSSDYSCASSVTDDEGFGAKAPGVVARLMGLDSLPTFNSVEPYSTPFFESQSLREAHSHRRNLDFHHNRPGMDSRNLRGKVDGPARSNMELRPQKLTKPIEKFQTEVLPPKSAKSIPSTHHRMLSPIKSPGFVPTKNATHIMEAAAKIIEQGPQTTTKAKVSTIGSSVPLKVRDLKEKVEAPQRPSRLAETPRRPIESNAAKYLKGQSLNKSWNGSVDTSFKVSGETEENSSGLKNKGKSISLAVQAKVNVQKREGLNPSSSRSLERVKEQSEVKSSQPFKNQSSMQKSTNKKSSSHSASAVLRQNNQKQNCITDKDKSSSKPSVSNLQGRKAVSVESSVGRQRNASKSTANPKIGSRKSSLELTDSEQEVSYSRMKNLPRKKRIIDGDSHLEKNPVVNNVLANKNEKPIQFNAATDWHFDWAEDSRKKGMDVVSFTFTAPMVRSTCGSEPSRQVAEKNNGLFPGHQVKKVLVNSDGRKLSSLGFNVLGGDALSVLLEQKLKELTYGIEPSHHNSIKTGASSNTASILEDLLPALNAVGDMPKLHDKRDKHGLQAGKYGRRFDSDPSSSEPPELQKKYKFQGAEEVGECNNGLVEALQIFDCRHPSPISILEPFPSESGNSSDSAGTDSTEGCRPCSSVQAQEVIGLGSSKKFCSVETDTELSDSASSTSTAVRKHATTVTTIDYARSNKWELQYVKEILCNVELMFKDFALGRAREIINPHLFDQLESRKGGLDINEGESGRRRKVLFDCVSECLDLRCRRFVGGGCGTWMKGVTVVRRNNWLAEEVYKEISGWRSMGDCMVDELVEKDMSSQHGRWVDFEVEAFGIGVEIEGQILGSLVDEVVADILIL